MIWKQLSCWKIPHVCYANAAGFNNSILVIFHPDLACSHHSVQLGDWFLISVLFMGGFRIHRKSPLTWAIPTQALRIWRWADTSALLPLLSPLWSPPHSILHHSQRGDEECADAAARLQKPGGQGSSSKPSLESIFLPSFFQVIHRDTRPGHPQSAKVELNS